MVDPKRKSRSNAGGRCESCRRRVPGVRWMDGFWLCQERDCRARHGRTRAARRLYARAPPTQGVLFPEAA